MKTTLPVRASRWAVAAILLALCGSPALAEDAAAPGAAPSTQGRRWMLDFSHGPLKRIQIDDGTGQLTTYLYMTLEVANHTGLARNWVPFVTGKVDTRATPYVAGGFPLALEAIRRKEGNKTLEAIDTSAWRKGDEGKLEDGASKKVVAIFGTVDPGWATFRVEVNGLMNPITTLKVRKYGDKQIVLEAAYAGRNAKVEAELKAAAKASQSEIPQPTAEYQEVQERRVRAIEYQRDGDEFRPDDDVIRFVREDWEVIGDPKVIRTIPSAS